MEFSFQNKWLAFLLAINAALLISLIPGGYIENRDFSHLSALILVAFNGLLTALGMSSLLAVPLALKNYQVVAPVSKVLALVYIIVYALDLLAIFPKTPSVMPVLLMLVECIGIVTAILLYAAAIRLARWVDLAEQTPNDFSFKKLSPLCILVLALVGNGIVIFSTYSALNSGQ
ncbi:hypothetical protein DS2_18453 [Catenovulum agarivorans DS-2]|uniref:DUF8051 domain-containing protein n=1 Tax=Catenovulum agarivorans DS-2 TaxID=1328313 RepID=W7Q8A5_9ALTE|nr:hypothetical protein [Catenovulum agarivorans]EWH08226.1 hypothetical protein DS2_18453 [Catenovulum agarivorans DS-2]